ncbi:MAG: 6-phospho-alpha-glucosidase [Clostridiaceae bacterium]|nr:6-phospho-alpha-glucosidase [Clostridiaceae bacterium]
MAVIVGGGSTWTPGILKSLCEHREEFPLSELRMFDIDAERQKIVGEFARILFAEEYPDLKFSYSTDKARAYDNCDFVFCQIRTGGFAMRQTDEQIPLAHGVVGQETCGPGGFAYGLRSIPDMIEVVRDARRYGNDPWILNYSNPAAIVALALQREFPNDRKIINMCDQPVNLLASYAKLLGLSRHDLRPQYIGLNHFGWFTRLTDATGRDRLPELRSKILAEGFLPADAAERDPSWLVTYGTVEQILRDFPDYLPNTYLQYYLYPEQIVERSDPLHTRTEEVQNGREKRVFRECLRVAACGTAQGSPLNRSEIHADMIVEVAASIVRNLHREFIMIVPNNGVVANFSQDAMIECLAVVNANGVEPYAFGEIDSFMKGLMESQFAYEKLTVDAYYEKSYTKALQALTLNRTVVDAGKARALLNDLWDVNRDYWPELR